MITIKIGKAIFLLVTSKFQTERFVVKWQINKFGVLFCLRYRSNESGNWIVFFFKEKITQKLLKLLGHPSRESDFKVSEKFALCKTVLSLPKMWYLHLICIRCHLQKRYDLKCCSSTQELFTEKCCLELFCWRFIEEQILLMNIFLLNPFFEIEKCDFNGLMNKKP